MGCNEDLESDINQFFKQIENQNISDSKVTLRILLDKYIHLNKAEYLMDKYDLNSIISAAKSVYASKTFPAYLGNSKSRVMEEEQKNLCLVEATVTHLNKKDCLKRLPKFNYREDGDYWWL